jgi:hypothetical protein
MKAVQYFGGLVHWTSLVVHQTTYKNKASTGIRLPSALTTGLALFVECLRHSVKAILHSAKSLPSVTIGKEYSANILLAKGSLPSIFLNTRRKKNPKIAKHFFNYGNNSPTTTHYHTHRPIFLTIILNQIYMFCEW